MAFEKAVRERVHARIALAGPSDSGKSYSALALATGLSPGSVGLIDTEGGKGRLYADAFDFGIQTLAPPFLVSSYLDLMKTAAEVGIQTLVIDSASHEWMGPGGIMERADEINAMSGGKKNPWVELTPDHNRFVSGIMHYPGHVIVTVRTKNKTVYETDDRGKKVPVTLPDETVQRPGFEYEFMLFGMIDKDTHLCRWDKNNTPLWKEGAAARPAILTPQHGAELAAWLWEGRNVEETTLQRDIAEAVKAFSVKFHVEESTLVEAIGKPRDQWEKEDLASLRDLYAQRLKRAKEAKGQPAKTAVLATPPTDAPNDEDPRAALGLDLGDDPERDVSEGDF